MRAKDSADEEELNNLPLDQREAGRSVKVIRCYVPICWQLLPTGHNNWSFWQFFSGKLPIRPMSPAPSAVSTRLQLVA